MAKLKKVAADAGVGIASVLFVLRCIVNPPGSTVRVHQHAEQARDVSLRSRDKALALVGKHFGSDTEAALTSHNHTLSSDPHPQ